MPRKRIFTNHCKNHCKTGSNGPSELFKIYGTILLQRSIDRSIMCFLAVINGDLEECRAMCFWTAPGDCVGALLMAVRQRRSTIGGEWAGWVEQGRRRAERGRTRGAWEVCWRQERVASSVSPFSPKTYAGWHGSKETHWQSSGLQGGTGKYFSLPLPNLPICTPIPHHKYAVQYSPF